MRAADGAFHCPGRAGALWVVAKGLALTGLPSVPGSGRRTSLREIPQVRLHLCCPVLADVQP
jgi:hypothetical protein